MADDTRSIWEFVPIENYQRPTEPATQAVRKGLRGWWDRLGGRPHSGDAVEGTRKWRPAPDELLDEAVPAPRWHDATGALTDALEDWWEAEQPAVAAQLLLAPPHSGVSEIAICWAKRNKVRLVKPPSTADILAGGAEWLAQFDSCDKSTVVVPKLERCYLRHYDGLGLVRRLIERMATGPHHCLLTCDSWAWAFLRRALAIDTLLPASLTLQAFDCSRLERELGALAGRDDGTDVQFLHTSNDKQFRLSGQTQGFHNTSATKTLDRDAAAGQVGNNTYLKHIAGYSRGLLKVAWSVWRRSLALPSAETEQESVLLDGGHLLWVKPWAQLDLPKLPPHCAESDLLVLHALLVHGGLHPNLLPMVLSSHPPDIIQSLHRLHDWQLLSEQEGRWEVSALGYPEVRRMLKSEGYLVDDC